MKEFMLQQLRDAMRFDCYEIDAATEQTPKEWFETEVDQATADLNRYLKLRSDRIAQTAEANRLLHLLRRSLDAYASAPAVVRREP